MRVNPNIDWSSIAYDKPYGVSGTPVHAYYYGTSATTLSTYTVGTGKVLYVFGWGFSAESSTVQLALQIDGTTVDRLMQYDSSMTNRGLNFARYTIPMKATAGQVVRIQWLAGDTGKNRASLFEAVEVDA
jgi:hypothetical protein